MFFIYIKILYKRVKVLNNIILIIIIKLINHNNLTNHNN
jgi:hypothetical protein